MTNFHRKIFAIRKSPLSQLACASIRVRFISYSLSFHESALLLDHTRERCRLELRRSTEDAHLLANKNENHAGGKRFVMKL